MKWTGLRIPISATGHREKVSHLYMPKILLAQNGHSYNMQWLMLSSDVSVVHVEKIILKEISVAGDSRQYTFEVTSKTFLTLWSGHFSDITKLFYFSTVCNDHALRSSCSPVDEMLFWSSNHNLMILSEAQLACELILFIRIMKVKGLENWRAKRKAFYFIFFGNSTYREWRNDNLESRKQCRSSLYAN